MKKLKEIEDMKNEAPSTTETKANMTTLIPRAQEYLIGTEYCISIPIIFWFIKKN